MPKNGKPFHASIRDCEKADFQKTKNAAIAIQTKVFWRGKKAAQKSENTNNPAKSESFPVNALWNCPLSTKSFKSSNNRPTRKPGEARRCKFLLLIIQERRDLDTLAQPKPFI